MTLQEAKDQVAKNYGYKTWSEIDFYVIDAMNETTSPPYAEERLNDEVAYIYGGYRYREGCKEIAKNNKF